MKILGGLYTTGGVHTHTLAVIGMKIILIYYQKTAYYYFTVITTLEKK